MRSVPAPRGGVGAGTGLASRTAQGTAAGATALHEKPEPGQCDFHGPEPGQTQNCTGMDYLQVLPPDANSSGAEGIAQSWAPGAAPGNPR